MAVERALCPLCGGPGEFAGRKSDYDFFRCSACDFMFVHPDPTPRQIEAYYSSNYRGASEDFYPKLNSRKRRALL